MLTLLLLIAFVAIQPTLLSGGAFPQCIDEKFSYITHCIAVCNDPHSTVGEKFHARDAARRMAYACNRASYNYNDIVDAKFGWTRIEKMLLQLRFDYLKTQWDSILDGLEDGSNRSLCGQYFESQWLAIKQIFDEIISITDKLTNPNRTWFALFHRASIILRVRNIPVRKEIRDEIIDYCIEAMKYFAQVCGDQTVYTEYALERLKEIDTKIPGLLATCERILKENPGYYECGSIKYFSNLMDRYYHQKVVEGRWRSQPIASGSCNPQ